MFYVFNVRYNRNKYTFETYFHAANDERCAMIRNKTKMRQWIRYSNVDCHPLLIDGEPWKRDLVQQHRYSTFTASICWDIQKKKKKKKKKRGCHNVVTSRPVCWEFLGPSDRRNCQWREFAFRFCSYTECIMLSKTAYYLQKKLTF